MANFVRESAQFIASKAKHVRIDEKAVEKLSKHVRFMRLKEGESCQLSKLFSKNVKELVEISDSHAYSLKSWKEHEIFPKVADEKAVEWIFIVDVLNFNFWNDDDRNKCVIRYKGIDYTGFMALAAAIDRACDNGMPILDPKFYATISEADLQTLLKPDSGDPMPLMPQRLEALREAGRVLNEKFGSSFVNCVKQAKGSALALLKIVVDNFTSFRDENTYLGQRVAFYKRAQILISDLWACFEGCGLCAFSDIESMTMFADYRIPQVLVHFGVLAYSDELNNLLKKSQILQYGDPMEDEIRGCTIHAVDLLYEKMREFKKERKTGPTEEVALNVILIDHYLWDYRREHAVELRSIPYHKVRCIYY